jgi:hypothetical protein
MTLHNSPRQPRLSSFHSPCPAHIPPVTSSPFTSSALFNPPLLFIPFLINTFCTLFHHGAHLSLFFSYPSVLFSSQRRVSLLNHPKFPSLDRPTALTMVNLSPAQLAPAQPNSSDSDLCLIPPATVTPVSATLTNHRISVASKGLTESLTPLSATLTENRGEGAPRPRASSFSLLACSDPVRDPSGTPSYLAIVHRTRITSFFLPPATRHSSLPLATSTSFPLCATLSLANGPAARQASTAKHSFFPLVPHRATPQGASLPGGDQGRATQFRRIRNKRHPAVQRLQTKSAALQPSI